MALGIAWFTLHSIGLFTFAPAVMIGRWSLGRALQTPVVYAALLALAFVLLRWQTQPGW